MQTDVKSIIFAGQNNVVCQTEETTLDPPANGVVIQTRYSCISAGTEVAKLTGLQPTEYPIGIGNRAIGRVLKVGPKCDTVAEGDLVFAHTHHASHVTSNRLLLKLPDELDRPEIAQMGMAMVAFVGIRVGQPEMGDTAVVVGAGLVGQFMAQLLELSGVCAIIVDTIPERLDIARSCGASHIINASIGDAVEHVMDLTDGGAEYVFECTGIPPVVASAPHYAGRSAQVILVGSPRGEFQTDLTAFLQPFHLWKPNMDLTLKGSHEWKVPLYPQQGYKHSQVRNGRPTSGSTGTARTRSNSTLSRPIRTPRCDRTFTSTAQMTVKWPNSPDYCT
jgi:threonine dehydrogenase-like Zn-dependent dehydrogenase